MIETVEKEVDMLERHLKVLQTVVENEPIGIVKTSNELGYAHHRIRYSFRILEKANLLSASPQGAITTKQTIPYIKDFDDQIDTIRSRITAMKGET